MSFTIPMDNTVVEESGFDNTPLPAGKYLASIVPTKKDSSAIEKRPFAKQGANTGITALGIRFRISDGQKGKGRNVFADVPLARKFAATGQGKYPNGGPAFLFFQFFRALGYDVDQASGFNLPEDRDLLGKEVELVLTIDVSGREPRNQVQFINKANGIPAQPASAAPAAAPWSPAGAPAAGAPKAWTPGAVPVAGDPQADAPWSPAAEDIAFASTGAGKGF